MKKPFSLCGVIHVIVIFSDTEPEGGSESPRAWPPPFLLDLRFVRFWLRHVRCYLGPPPVLSYSNDPPSLAINF